MNTKRFDWYQAKASSNYVKHGVTFDQRMTAINDELMIDWIDERNSDDEERVNALGRCNGKVLHVTYAERGDTIWIISTRKATPNERNDYFRQNFERWHGR